MLKHDYEKRVRYIELISKKNYSVRSVAKELGVAKSLVQRGWKMYEYHGMKGLMANKLLQLEQNNVEECKKYLQ
jgi:transposase